MDWAGNAHRSNNLLAHADCGRNSGNSRLSFFDRSSPALLLGFVQGRRERWFRRNYPGTADIGASETTGNSAGQGLLSIECRQPCFPVRCRMKGNLCHDIRLIDQAGPCTLRLRNPGEAVRINNRDPTEAFCRVRQPIQDWLADVWDARADQKALANDSQAQGQAIEAAVRVLLGPAQVAQGGEKTVSRALGHVEAAADLAEWHRARILAEQGDEVEAAFDEGFDKPHGTTLSRLLERHSTSIIRGISQTSAL